MDKTLQRLESALGALVASSPQWPRKDALDTAEAIARDLLNLVRAGLQSELAFDTRGHQPSIATLRQWRRKCYNQTVVIKTMRKTAVDIEVRPLTGKALPHQQSRMGLRPLQRLSVGSQRSQRRGACLCVAVRAKSRTTS